MTTNSIVEDNQQLEEKFPYRFLLRYEWPDHIDRYLRRLMWSWLQEQSADACDDLSSTDYVAAHLFWLIAVSPETPGAVLDALSNMGSTSFLERVAENKNTWASTLSKLGQNASSTVRAAVAENPNTTSATMMQLSLDESADVRYAVADNANQALTILEAMLDDENAHVAARSRRTLAQMNLVKPTVLKPSQKSKKRKTAVGA